MVIHRQKRARNRSTRSFSSSCGTSATHRVAGCEATTGWSQRPLRPVALLGLFGSHLAAQQLVGVCQANVKACCNPHLEFARNSPGKFVERGQSQIRPPAASARHSRQIHCTPIHLATMSLIGGQNGRCAQECGCDHPLIVSDPPWLSECPALGDISAPATKSLGGGHLQQVVCGRAALLQTECGAQPLSANAPGCVFVGTAPSLGSYPQPAAVPTHPRLSLSDGRPTLAPTTREPKPRHRRWGRHGQQGEFRRRQGP